MKLIFASLLLSLTAASGLHALEVHGHADTNLHPVAAALEHVDAEAPRFSQNRVLSREAAQALLNGTEGPGWNVLHVHGPVCAKGMKRTDCQVVRKSCDAAKKLALEYKAPVTCSALYTEQMVEITTASAPTAQTKVKAEKKASARKAPATPAPEAEELPPK